MSHVEQLEPEATEGKRRRANPEEEAQRKQQKCDMRDAQTSSKPVSYTQAAEATTNHENDNEPRRTTLITKISQRGKATARQPRGRSSTEAAEVRYTQTEAASPSRTHTPIKSFQQINSGRRQGPSTEVTSLNAGAEHMKCA